MVKCPGCGEENPPKFRLCGYCGTSLAPALPVQEVRKTVTLLFTDLKDSTALGERLDSETLHEVKELYFAAMAAQIRHHGGKIEKYIGDAIMAVFGLPRAREDDALRAVRAAAGMRKALAGVNAEVQARFGVVLSNRTGVNTGEVLASGDASADQKLATGDAVNVTARLEQAAPANEVYIGELTFQLVRNAVEVEAVEPLTLKGKSQPVGAFRLISVSGEDGNARRSDTPMVGRDAELAALEALYREVCDTRAVRLATVMGDAGSGKSRLVHEVVEHIATGARVLRGRCISYGDGMTFWPLRSMVARAADIRDEDTPDTAQAKLLGLAKDPDVAERIAAAAGWSPTPFPLQEVYWAVRKLLEHLASTGPVVVLVDDIHWAEPAFLDLIEYVLDTSSGAAILLLATSRLDLLEERPQWGENDASLRLVLSPLSDEASARIVGNLIGSAGLPADIVAKVVGAAEGNPLYVEQMLSMLIESGALRQEQGRWIRAHADAEITVPPTIHALLEARLDRLGREERAAVEPAAVIGLEFGRSALASIAPEVVRPSIDKHLGELTRKQFVTLWGTPEADPTYRFQHHLVRDTVYGGLLKRARVNLHMAFARWMDRVNADRDRALEFEEILGYHLEQATHYRRELGPLDSEGLAVAQDGAQRLSNAGRRAFARGDMNAAVKLFRRAAQLLPDGDPQRLALLPQLGEALAEIGEFVEARRFLGEAEAAAELGGLGALRASARIVTMFVRLYSGDTDEWGRDALQVASEAIPALELSGDSDALATAWRLVGLVHGVAGRYGQAGEATDQYVRHARQAGNRRLMARSALGMSINLLFGPTSARAAIAQCEQVIRDGLDDRSAEGVVLCAMAQLHAMNGDFDRARALVREGRGLLRELGQGVTAASTGIDLARVELLAGDVETAETEVRADYEFLAAKQETYFLATIASLLARIVREQGRDEEALRLLKAAEAAAASDDHDAQALWRSVSSPIAARAGDLVAAEALAREAVERADFTEAPILQADTRADLAAVLATAGRTEEALAVNEEAAAIYAGKGDVVSAAKRKAWAASLMANRGAA